MRQTIEGIPVETINKITASMNCCVRIILENVGEKVEMLTKVDFPTCGEKSGPCFKWNLS